MQYRWEEILVVDTWLIVRKLQHSVMDAKENRIFAQTVLTKPIKALVTGSRTVTSDQTVLQ